jgi:hypothetical protein
MVSRFSYYSTDMIAIFFTFRAFCLWVVSARFFLQFPFKLIIIVLLISHKKEGDGWGIKQLRTAE